MKPQCQETEQPDWTGNWKLSWNKPSWVSLSVIQASMANLLCSMDFGSPTEFSHKLIMGQEDAINDLTLSGLGNVVPQALAELLGFGSACWLAPIASFTRGPLSGGPIPCKPSKSCYQSYSPKNTSLHKQILAIEASPVGFLRSKPHQ